jgi:hypothetical protein
MYMKHAQVSLFEANKRVCVDCGPLRMQVARLEAQVRTLNGTITLARRGMVPSSVYKYVCVGVSVLVCVCVREGKRINMYVCVCWRMFPLCMFMYVCVREGVRLCVGGLLYCFTCTI